jgi:hypothetical protein
VWKIIVEKRDIFYDGDLVTPGKNCLVASHCQDVRSKLAIGLIGCPK